MQLEEKNIFFLSRSPDTTTGSTRFSEVMMSTLTVDGADPVRAIKGASIKALNPPISLKDFLKSLPLSINDHKGSAKIK